MRSLSLASMWISAKSFTHITNERPAVFYGPIFETGLLQPMEKHFSGSRVQVTVVIHDFATHVFTWKPLLFQRH
jgi:hypothetical protein